MTPGLLKALTPIMLAVLVVFLITGAALPALPLHIHEGLGFGAAVVGLVSGAQFAASLLSRLASGSFSDRHGPKTAMILGLLMAVGSGGLYLTSMALQASPVLSVSVLLVGRALLGGAESFVITGAQSWGLALAPDGTAGKVIGWIGTAMYVALAVGAPIGSVLFATWGFNAIGIATVLVPIASLALLLRVTAARPASRPVGQMVRVFKAVWLPGIGLAAASLGYGASTAFAVLLFTQRGWEPAWLSFTLFAAALIVARLAFGGLPDRIGGARAAMILVIVQAIGMALIWAAPTALLGFSGALIAGFGYAFVYPGLGIEAVRKAPVDSRGAAMGIYTAFLDVALGILTPLLGLLADITGIGSIFLVSALLAMFTVPIATRLTRRGE